MLLKVVIDTIKENKESICDEWKDLIDVPFVSDKEEAYIESIIDAGVEVLEKVLFL